MRIAIIALVSLFSFHAKAQQPPAAIKGTFHVCIDDSIRLYLNGAQILSVNNYKATQTSEVEIKPGDRIVAQVVNRGGPRGLMLLFVSSDLKEAVKFTNVSFKILQDPGKIDFTPVEFAAGRVAKDQRWKKQQPFPFKTSSEWVWGETDSCTLAATITKDMFQPLQR